MNVPHLAFAMIAVVGCTDPPREPPRTDPLPEYHSCESLGDRRFEARYCVHAEGVRIDDYQFRLCPNVYMNPRPELYVRIDEVTARRIGQERGWAEGTFEVSGNEGSSAIVDLDVCVLQHEWSADDRRHRAGRASSGILDVSRPFHIELRAARYFQLRPPGGGRAELAAVGEWPLRVAAPPVEWLGYPGCGTLPERFTAEATCVHVEHLTVRDEPFPLCDRLTLVPSLRLTGAIHDRLYDHLAVGVHSEARWFEVEDGGEYVVTLDVCIYDSDIAQAPNSAPTAARGLIDPRRKLRVEIERARFRYRWRAEGPFQEGRLGETEASREDQTHE